MKQSELLSLPFLYNENEVCLTLRVRIDALRAWIRRDELRPVAQNAAGLALFKLSDIQAIGARLAAQENVRLLRANPINVTAVPSRNRPDRPSPKPTS